MSSSSCVPCSSLDKSSLLTRAEVHSELQSSLPLWSSSTPPSESESKSKSVEFVERSFTAKNFQCALDAINSMGAIAEREGHHPDFHLTSYREVRVVLYTHKVGGVTANDLQLAKMFDDEVAITYSPKWLKEHPAAPKKKMLEIFLS